VSDGLALDLWRLARASGVRVVLERAPAHRDAARLARRDGRGATWHALHDGEDHELLACLAPADAARALRAAPRRCPELADVGRVERGAGLWLELDGQPAREWSPDEGGWLHGR
jgi:thiamine monophosphate kinase